MTEYIEGLIVEARNKAIALKGKFKPYDLDTRFHRLSQPALNQLDRIILVLDNLLTDREYQGDSAQPLRLKEFKSLFEELNRYENVVLAVLSRHHDDDVIITNVVEQICKEINYPLLPPIATCLSQSYYCIHDDINLLCVPLLETDFLLNLPDLYHELGHPLIAIKNHPNAKHYQTCWANFNQSVRLHYKKDINYHLLNGSSDFVENLKVWQKCWLNSTKNNWSTEFFCDLFALYTVGEAYAWTHLHSFAKNIEPAPYYVPLFKPNSHPADHARMIVLIEGLKLMGLKDSADRILIKWNDILTLLDFKKNASFKFAYPRNLLIECAEKGLEAVKSINCLTFDNQKEDSISALLNNAWKQFWKMPIDYQNWEERVVNLKFKKI